jgi:hypothetical protein
MTPAWFLLMLVAAPHPALGTASFNAPVAMMGSFPTERACWKEARTNPKISYTNAGKLDPSISVGVVCLKGLVRKGHD